MSAMSDYLENKFLDHFLGTTSTSAPAAVYLSLHTTSPTDDGSGAELSGRWIYTSSYFIWICF